MTQPADPTGPATNSGATSGTTSPSRPAPARREAYPHFDRLTTRWRDNDVYAHMNNAVYYEYIDTIVNAWLIRSGGLKIPDGPVVGLVVETGCIYRASLGFPDRIDGGLRVARIGRSSVRYEVGLFAEAAPTAAAEAHFTHVYVDSGSHRPVPVPEKLRAALAALRTDQGA